MTKIPENTRDKLPAVNRGRSKISLEEHVISKYSQACKKVQEKIDRTNASITLCSAPEAYVISRILERLQTRSQILIVPSFRLVGDVNAYKSIKKAMNGNPGYKGVSIICNETNSDRYLELGISALNKEAMTRNINNIDLLITGIIKSENDTIEAGSINTEFLKARYCKNFFAVPNLLAHYNEIKGIDIVNGVLTETRYFGEFSVYNEDRRVFGPDKKKTIHDQFIDAVILLGENDR